MDELLQLIESTPFPASDGYDPLALIRVVNRLQPLGKTKAIDAIWKYLRTTPDDGRYDAQRGVHLLLRVLFEIPKDLGYFPPLNLGAPDVLPLQDPTLCPRFPIILEGNIPFIIVAGYTLFGYVGPADDEVKFFSSHYEIRSEPLTPSNRVFEVMGSIDASRPWNVHPDEEFIMRERLLDQALRLVRAVFSVVDPPSFIDMTLDHYRESLRTYQKELDRLGVKWDPKIQDYSRG